MNREEAKMEYETIIGIDPDMEKSGIAIYHRKLKILFLDNFNIYQMIKFVELYNKHTTIFAVEAGYLNKSNWHIKNAGSKVVASEIGRRTGENHATAKHIVSILRGFGFEVIEQRPLAKVWRGGKISHKEFLEKCSLDGVTVDVNRSNQEQRDAGLIALAIDKKMIINRK